MRPSYGLGLSIECYTGCRPWETPIRSLLLFLFHMKKRKDWFKPKKYPHIGLPLELKDRHKVECYVRNPQKIAHHSFLPLIRREQVSHRYREQDGVRNEYPNADRFLTPLILMLRFIPTMDIFWRNAMRII